MTLVDSVAAFEARCNEIDDSGQLVITLTRQGINTFSSMAFALGIQINHLLKQCLMLLLQGCLLVQAWVRLASFAEFCSKLIEISDKTHVPIYIYIPICV